MRESVLTCPVGDDIYLEDPSTSSLEQYTASLFNKQSALFMPSGTMSNLVAVMTHCQQKGSSAILGDKSHINNYEGGGIATIANVMTVQVTNQPDGTWDLNQL
jgi:threonine aldolase